MNLLTKILFYTKWYEPLEKDVKKWQDQGKVQSLKFLLQNLSYIPEGKRVYLCKSVIEALTELRVKSILPILVNKIDDKSEIVSYAAMASIKKLGLEDDNLRIKIRNKLVLCQDVFLG